MNKTRMNKTGVGIIGCGNIFYAYGRGCKFFNNLLEVRAVADLDLDRARATATEWEIPKAVSPEELLADPDIGIVVNLTIPRAHAAVDLQIIDAGKHPYSEKPLAVERADGIPPLMWTVKKEELSHRRRQREHNINQPSANNTAASSSVKLCGWSLIEV
jgi:hypothetical protein